jgi:hypothetical protein
MVTIRPRMGWSEEGGLLGAELACGILHVVPKTCRRTCGKDRATSNEVVQESELVRTSEGVGQLLQTHRDGSVEVRLDWGLGPNVKIIGQFAAKNVEPVATAH